MRFPTLFNVPTRTFFTPALCKGGVPATCEWGVPKKEMAGIALESWLDWDLGTEEDSASRLPEVDVLAAHDEVTSDPGKPTTKMVKLVNRGRHAAHTASLDHQLPETARPSGSDDPLLDGGRKTRALTKARCRSLQGTGTATAWHRARPNGLDSSANRLRVREHGTETEDARNRGLRGGDVPLLRYSRRLHATRTRLPPSRSAGEPVPAAAPRDHPHTYSSDLGSLTKSKAESLSR